MLIFGDYDANGVSSTTVLMMTLRDLGAQVQFYIPNRFREGYGPNKERQIIVQLGVQSHLTNRKLRKDAV
jgi:single-stranded DNA-specific DHH superfamily exonuclease